MKKFFVLLSAVALFGLTACTMQEQLGPKAEGVKDEVKSSFSFNIAGKANTKATAADVQADGTAASFRGMTGMKLFVTNGNPSLEDVDFMSYYQYPLGSLSSAALAQRSSHVYLLSLPIGVDNMVFYARATKSANNNPERFGNLKWTVGENKQSTSFESVPIVADATTFTDISSQLEGFLNFVFGPDTSWPSAESADLQDRALAEIYKRVTDIRQGEFRDGSGAAILRLFQEVLDIIDPMVEADIYGQLGYENVVYDPTWDLNNITSAISIRLRINHLFFDDAPATPILPLTSLGNVLLDKFPGNLGLPAGSAQLTFDKEAKKFEYAEQPDAFGGATSKVASVTKFTYPVELTYFVNSPVRVTNQVIDPEQDYPVTVPTWSAADWGSKWPQSGISSVIAPDTRAVALQNNIQYGVALLKTTVKYGADVLIDNTAEMAKKLEPTATNVPNKQITVTDTTFTLKGILVGGQPGKVDWNWVPAEETFANVVYDHYLGDATAIPTPQGKAAYTMVFDNLKEGATADQSDVYVALELVNDAKDEDGNPVEFYGRDNLIPAGGTFYLVGKLNFKDADKSGISYPENTDGNGLRFPPFDGVKNDKVVRVFMQDYVTEAKFSINEKALQSAYVTIPDLRSIEMVFGLSVDLAWSAGMSFDIQLD